MKSGDLLEKIHTAFSDLPYPGGHDYYRAIADRDYEEYVSTGKKMRWTDITREDLTRYYDFIFFLQADGVLYYLPSYMTMIVKDNAVAGHQATECCFMAIKDLNLSRLGKRRQVIYDFLVYCRDVIDSEIELDDDLLQSALAHVGNGKPITKGQRT